MKTVEKLGNGEKTIEAVDRIDGSDVVFCIVLRQIMSYSSQISGKQYDDPPCRFRLSPCFQ